MRTCPSQLTDLRVFFLEALSFVRAPVRGTVLNVWYQAISAKLAAGILDGPRKGNAVKLSSDVIKMIEI